MSASKGLCQNLLTALLGQTKHLTMESRCSLQERFLFYFALYCDQMTNLLRSTEEIVRKKVVALSSKACNAKKSLLKLKQELKGNLDCACGRKGLA